jgi:beta-N-acetylhexosaminidase
MNRSTLALVVFAALSLMASSACNNGPSSDEIGLVIRRVASPSVTPTMVVTPAATPSGTCTLPLESDLADAAELASQLTLEQEVGQMMMIGIVGPSLDSLSRNAIRDYHFGNVALLGRNLESIDAARTLAGELQETASEANNGIGMLVAADLEGGTVWRVPPDVPSFPSAAVLGATGSPEMAEEAGAAVGKLALALGMNTDLAPVLDVNDNPANPVIGPRSYGGDPDSVAVIGEAFIRGLRCSGVVPVAKHFPGHGSTSGDPHELLPVVGDSIEEIRAVELEPFRLAIESGLPAVMTAHVYYPALSGPVPMPATLSPEVITGILREELHFGGVVLSDDFGMGAITENFGIVDAAIRAVSAGVDIIVIAGPWDVTQEELLDREVTVHRGIVQAVEDGRISRAVVDAAVTRILSLKLAFGVGSKEGQEEPELAIREIERVARLISDASTAR